LPTFYLWDTGSVRRKRGNWTRVPISPPPPACKLAAFMASTEMRSRFDSRTAGPFRSMIPRRFHAPISCGYFELSTIMCFYFVTSFFLLSLVFFTAEEGRQSSSASDQDADFLVSAREAGHLWAFMCDCCMYIRSSYCGSASVWFPYPVSECVATSRCIQDLRSAVD
jgi:hypothetical protein